MKIRLFAALTALVLLLAACGSTVTPEATTAPPASFSEQDLVFVYNGVEYPMLSDAAPLIEALGPDYTLDAAISCVYSQYGDDKTFEYNDISIYTNPTKEGKDAFYEIDLNGGDFSTSKGIKVGSSEEDIKAAYGDEGFIKDDTLTYSLSGDPADIASPFLGFMLTDGVVSGIVYYYPTNLT